MQELRLSGWFLEADTVYSPSRGLWLAPAHFEDWSPPQMHSVFVGRARRIEQAKVGAGWEQSAQENHQIHRAIERLGWAEPDAPPNGGPGTRLGNSGVAEGPPSVS
jgi:hypothetical protein